MELNNEIFSKLLSLIEEAKQNKDYELEARFWSKKGKILINEENYNKVFQKLTFSKEYNGYAYDYEMKNMLDVIIDKNYNDNESIRMTIKNTDSIKKYWLNQELDETNVSFIEKERIDKIDEDNYNIRFSLNNEIPQNNILEKNKNLILSTNYDKVFRLKNRYSIKTDDNLFLIDMSSIKMGSGVTFRESNTLKANPKYEIEIEYIGKNIELDTKTVGNKLLNHCSVILKILKNNNILLKNSVVNSVKKYYQTLSKSPYEGSFIAASPVTIHKEHLLKNDNVVNIYRRYAVTLKADGSRNFLIVYKSNNEDENGKIFIFNSNFNFIDTGFIDKEWTGTLIECELVDKELYMYDILFSKDEDVRRRHLVNIQKESLPTRLELLNKFMKSTSRKMSSVFLEENCIKIKEKQYRWSVRPDGSDIFEKIKDVWDNKKYSSFDVDGVILVPILDYYPMRGGSWPLLFKWKPPQLNTIDFLIKVMKDDNNKDIKNPYIDVIHRIDGKQETNLKQYKNIQLYVTDQKIIYGNNNKKTYKKIPGLFNPFGTDEKNSEIYNLVKIFIEDDEKIYANDPISEEKVEIYDDIIVEFGYDDSLEEGFKWIPYRFRKDKTEQYKNGEDMFGNSKITANDIFRAINNPITEEMITTGMIPINQDKTELDKKPYYVHLVENNNSSQKNRLQYRNFHNHYIKYQLLYLSSPSYINGYVSGVHGKILDLCCGKGVDINKIKRAKYAEVVGMDIDYEGIKFAEEFFRTRVPTPKPKAYYVRGDSSKLIWPEQACSATETEKMKTKKFIPSKYIFDTVSLQFCFHYFFQSEITFRTILQNINDNLKIGGFVIGTTFDGERIYDSLKSTGSISGKMADGSLMWKIDRKYSSTKLAFTDKKSNFGKEIDVYVQSIGQVHTEYLVNFNYMDKIMQEYGFTKVFIKPFEDFYNELKEGKQILDLSDKEFQKDIDVINEMSEDEKRFSFLSSGFIYKKERNSSDSLLKKLIEQMEKKHKLKGKNAYKVSEDTEHTIEAVTQ